MGATGGGAAGGPDIECFGLACAAQWEAKGPRAAAAAVVSGPGGNKAFTRYVPAPKRKLSL